MKVKANALWSLLLLCVLFLAAIWRLADLPIASFGQSVKAAQEQAPLRAAPVILTDEQGEYPLGLFLEILQDPSRELTIEQVSLPEYTSRFLIFASPLMRFGCVFGCATTPAK